MTLATMQSYVSQNYPHCQHQYIVITFRVTNSILKYYPFVAWRLLACWERTPEGCERHYQSGVERLVGTCLNCASPDGM